jgi:hypothetical protein
MRPSLLVWPDEGSLGGVPLTLSIGTTPLLGAVTAGDFLVTDGNSGGDGTNLVERYFVYNPAGVAMGNVYTDWPTLAAVIAALQLGESPVVTFVQPATLIPSLGMPVGGWDMRGGTWRSWTEQSGAAVVLLDPLASIDNLFGISNGLTVELARLVGPSLTFSLQPAGGAQIFAITAGAYLNNTIAANAAIHSPGAVGQTTMVVALKEANQNAPYNAPSLGPILQLNGNDGAVIAQYASIGGAGRAPAQSWIVGGGLLSGLIVIVDSSGTLPSEWSAGYTGGGSTFIFYTDRNGLQGTTLERPVFPVPLIGFVYFDTTVGFPIWWDGAIWVDAAGAPA